MHVAPGVTDRELRDALLRLIADPAEWRRLHEGGLRYARSISFAATARKVLDAVMNL